MLKNYFTIAINNLLKNKLYSTINIIGLAIGLAVFILITIYVRDEMSFDKQWDNANCIYRINNVMDFGKPPAFKDAITPPALLPALKDFFSDEIEFGTRIITSSGELQIDEMRFPASISGVDEDFISMFQCEVLFGNLESTFQNPNNIALNEDLAKKCFGENDPTGKMITFIYSTGDKRIYKVTAVYRFKSSNTVLNVSCFSLLNPPDEGGFSWNMLAGETYVRLNKTADVENINKRLSLFVEKNVPPVDFMILPPGKKISDVFSFPLQKMSDIYFNPIPSAFTQQLKIGNQTVIKIFMMISALVLIIACINFIILTTAKATQRALEVAIRKAVGARFGQLFTQFICESVLITLTASLLSVAILEAGLPLFEMIMDKNLTVPYSSPGSYLFMMLLVLIVGLLGGIYPALVLSGFSPSRASIVNKSIMGGGSLMFRNVLVIFQFAISITLIIATIIAYCQLRYTSRHDPGFNPENLLVVEGLGGPNDIKNYKNTLRQELLKLPAVSNACLSSLQPKYVGGGMHLQSGFHPKTDDSTSGQEITFNIMLIDYDFFETYGISLLSGRSFTQGIDREESGIFNPAADINNEKSGQNRLLINAAAARQIGYASPEEAVGKILESGEPGSPGYTVHTIIGVVADSQFESLRKKPVPEAYILSPDSTLFLTVRYHGNYQIVADQVKSVWQKIVGDVPFICSNIKQNLANSFSHEEKENIALISFAILSVFIACMGLYGMAVFTTDRRVKEIGLRKVMGAKVKDIVKLLVYKFLKPVLIANIMAWPVATYAMQNWLERFPYRFNSLFIVPICMTSALIALAIALFTVIGNTTIVARKNPVHSLRYE